MLIEKWHPVTSDMGFIQASVERTVAEFASWHESLGLEYNVCRTSSLGDALESLLPLSAELRCKLFLPTTAGWTAFLQSGILGSDPTPVMSVLSERLEVMAMRVCATHPSARWPGVIWEVFAPKGGKPPLNYRRAIWASNDGGGWIFGESGSPFAFENLAAYARPKKRDRFTRELLAQYLGEFNLVPHSDSFYPVSSEQPGILLERTTRWNKPPPEFSLEEVIDGLPWKTN